MKSYHGTSIFDSIAMGPIHVYKKKTVAIPKFQITDERRELSRYETARKTAADQIKILYDQAMTNASKEAALIFDTHSLLIEDPDFLSYVEKIILDQRQNAEYAISEAKEYFRTLFSSMDDAYMKERAADICDVADRILSILSSHNASTPILEKPCILVAKDLLPSETMQLDKSKLLALIIQNGSENSHTAILAKTLGIPALLGIPMEEDWNNHLAIVDGKTGLLLVDPDRESIDAYTCEQEKQTTEKEALLSLKGLETITKDGKKLSLYANIGSVSDVDIAIAMDAEGIGLFRSEFLYLESKDYPTEEEQFIAYKTVLTKMNPKPVIIRTLDIGADKSAPYMSLAKEENPAMGLRGIRFCLTNEDIFATQLRALLRASVYGNLSLLFPMIISVSEMQQIKRILNRVKEELISEKLPFHDVPIGVMIETPAAVMISDLLAKEVDFFSIGTNDLSQYTLAIDRQNPALSSFFEADHEATLRMIQMVTTNAHKEGIWVGICGELAAEQSLTKRFLEMGIDELSVSPSFVLALRKKIRTIFVQK